MPAGRAVGRDRSASEADHLRRWRPSGRSIPTLVGIAAGVALYLVVVVRGELVLGAAVALLILLAVSLARFIRQTRTIRRRARGGEPVDRRP